MSAGPFDAPGRWFKGNLHTHTTNSDGRRTPQQVVDTYREHGYDFLSLTDHRRVTPPSGLSALGMLLVPGMELNCTDEATLVQHHLVVLGERLRDDYAASKSLPELLAGATRDRALIMACHPYWLGQTAPTLLELTGACFALEIYNHGCELENGKGLAGTHWDDVLDRGGRFWGLAVDDAHWRIADGCGGWIMLKAPELTVESVLAALRDGLFYSSRGPAIHNIERVDSRVRVTCSPAKSVRFMSNRWFGRVVHADGEALLERAEYILRGGEAYVRVEVVDEHGKSAWSNPIFIE